VIPPSLNSTVPVPGSEVLDPGATALTVAVNVTVWPRIDGLDEDVRLVMVVFARFTVWLTSDESPLKFASPPYVAVMVLVPAVVEVSEHVPAATVPVHVAVPSLTVTLPVGVPLPGLSTVTL
jgi:hypothetical protein